MFCILRFNGKVKDFNLYLKVQRATLEACEEIQRLQKAA
ncbi:hypothetical protein SAMN00017405_0415 [Desulfonispora thiosulfatigenes DSM 11270]|uniref:Uncharacterized protein n=1 Tax=Desulfonispora thiosulfatigenes DSM 11270 TaxID=656914 RepID=A0A1W1VQF2_DESTI|nr:hypothetical protein SAMN00017405_0415 [Desulfonispora thiosulfatigenes DSM 11270]